MNLILSIAMLCQINPASLSWGTHQEMQVSCQKYYAQCIGDIKSKTMGEIDQKLLECIKNKPEAK